MIDFLIMGPLAIACFLLGVFAMHRRYKCDCEGCLSVMLDHSEGGSTGQAFLIDVAKEINRARKIHRNEHMMAGLMEECGELAKALQENHGPIRVWIEATHVACVAARIALEGDGDFAPPVPVKPAGPMPDMDEADSLWPSPPSRARVGGEI